MEGKWFALSGENADSWGGALNGGNGLTVQKNVPKSVVDKLYLDPGKLDGVGPGVYAQRDQLDLINEHGGEIGLWPK